MDAMKVGAPICNDVTFASSCIRNVIPVRWDGMKDQYVVAKPGTEQGHIIQFENGETVMLTTECENKDALLDII